MKEPKQKLSERTRKRSILLYHAVKQGRVTKTFALTELTKMIEINEYPENLETYKEAVMRINDLTPDMIGIKKK